MNVLPSSVKTYEANSPCCPSVRFVGQNKLNHEWSVSILLPSLEPEEEKFACPEGKGIEYSVLEKSHDFAIERFVVTFDQTERERVVKYTFLDRTFTLTIPGTEGPIRTAFFSCNGFHSKEDEESIGGSQKMWDSFRTVHKENPPHLMLFGGDQEYFDPLFKLPSIQEWLKRDYDERIELPFTEEMEREVAQFYFEKYLEKYKSGTPFAEATSSSASKQNWDDHDIFDGWGSYEEKLQNCPVFQGIYKIARDNYLIFQKHTDPRDPIKTGDYLGEGHYSSLSTIGDLGVLVVDTRSQRTRESILTEESWKDIYDSCEGLEGCKHLYVMLPVPIIYPDFGKLEKLADKGEQSKEQIKGVVESFKTPSIKELVISPLGTIELQDDMIDHWRSKRHVEERRKFIKFLQELAISKNMRITFLSGDVHLAGLGELKDPSIDQKKYDPRYMAQVISSPMGNIPGGKPMAIYLSYFNNKTEVFDEKTHGELVKIHRDEGGAEQTLFSKRNWATLTYDPRTENVQVRLHIESKKHQALTGTTIKTYSSVIPPLLEAPVNPGNVQKQGMWEQCVLI